MVRIADDGGEAPFAHDQIEVCHGSPKVSLSSNVRCFALNKADIDPVTPLDLSSCLQTKMLMLCSRTKGCWFDSELSAGAAGKLREYSGDASVYNDRDVDEVLPWLDQEACCDSIITENSH